MTHTHISGGSRGGSMGSMDPPLFKVAMLYVRSLFAYCSILFLLYQISKQTKSEVSFSARRPTARPGP